MEVEKQESTPIATVITAVVSAVVALIPALTQLFTSEKRYEVLFLSAAAFMGVIVWFQNRRSLDELHHTLSDMKEEHQRCRTDIRALQDESHRKTGHLNATINNMYRDLVRLAGRRTIGLLRFEQETGTYHYQPADDRVVRRDRRDR